MPTPVISSNSLPFRFTRIFVRWGWLLFILIFLQTYFDDSLTDRLQQELTNRDGVSAWVYALAALSLFVSLIFPSIVFLIVGLCVRSSWKSPFRKLNELLIETIRYWGKSIAWGLLFILPGLVKWTRYSFTPLVVLFSEEYERGEMDALEESVRLSHGSMWPLTWIYLVMGAVVPLVMTTLDPFKSFSRTPIAYCGVIVCETVFAIIFCLWLIQIFEQRLKKENLALQKYIQKQESPS